MPPSLDDARERDHLDPLRDYRSRFHIPRRGTERDVVPVAYFCGNSLGLQPRTARDLVIEELEDWAQLGVEGHFRAHRPWYPYHELFRDTGARLVGARPGEVVMMNSLTINLHLMMVTFYQPTADRYKVLVDGPMFPSDRYAVQTHQRSRGVEAEDAIQEIRPRDGRHTVDIDDLCETIDLVGDRLAMILLSGVNFLTGQLLDLERVARIARANGCVIGLDLAHAAGNVPLHLHDWDVDFAVWCSYKYLNAGPGAVAGCFVHERHTRNVDLPRFAGWWGNDPDTRFEMQLRPDFVPRASADGWQVSNPPILAMAPLKASLDMFDEVGMAALREKSMALTGFLYESIEARSRGWFDIITPAEPEDRGCQLSILVKDRPRERFKALTEAGVVCDFRQPNVIRVAPVPLYNTFEDCWRCAEALVSVS